MKVTKRTGEIVDFDIEKISIAIGKAYHATHGSEPEDDIAQHVIETFDPTQVNFTIEEIQDAVEATLMDLKFFEVAKSFIIYRARRNEQRKELKFSTEDLELKQLAIQSSKAFDNDPMREFIYMRTYSRWIKEKNRREMWTETVDRYVDFLRENLGEKLGSEVYNDIHKFVFEQKVMPSMRLLQFAGPAARRCNVCVYNCAFTAPQSIKDIVDVMYLSMSGTGVGFSVEAVNVAKLPEVQDANHLPENQACHQIEDSKEGWCDAFQLGLEKWFAGGDVIFDFLLLRPAGARLMTMGGRSSGPKPLMDLMQFTREIFVKRRKSSHKKLTTLDVHDIICKIGQIVVAGGVRRSALISLSDFSDHEMRDCKSGQFWNTNSQRCLANNSAIYDEKPEQIEFMKEWLALAQSGTGERGIFNRSGLRNVLPQRRVDVLGGRIDSLGVNPCGEILLQPFQFCNLTEVICRPDDTLETLRQKIRVATVVGTCQASLSDFKYISPQWKKNQDEERLLGVSLTGIYDCPALQDPGTLDQLRRYAVDVNGIYADALGINRSTAITCVKPSGTVSQMVNSSSGIHPRFSKYYIRRVRISSTDPLLELMKNQGYECYPEVGQSEPNVNTYVLEFPVKSPDGTRTAEDISSLEQLENWKKFKIEYVEHNPSVTIYVKPDEWLQTGKWVWDNWDYITGLAFLPYSEHVYQLAPYESIDVERYEVMKQNLKHVDFSKLKYYEKEDTTDVKKQMACVGGVCEL